MDKVILRKFLKCGFMENKQLHPTIAGTPQGGIISPALALLALSGLENNLLSSSIKRHKKEKIHFISYADDFIVTAANKETLEDKVIPELKSRLAKVGLELSSTKTRITHITEGFDFLGFSMRKYKNGKLLIKPSKESIKGLLKKIKFIIKKSVSLPTEKLIYQLNNLISGWTNYYRTSVSSKVFSRIDSYVCQSIMRMMYKRHARKGKRWIVKKYFTTVKGNCWRFYCMIKDKAGGLKPLYLKNASDTKIRRHVKIKSGARVFDPLYKEYFEQREQKRVQRNAISNFTDSAGLRVIQSY